MKTILRFVVAIVSMLLFLSGAHAAPLEWEIDHVHSSVFFDVRHTFVTVRGQFDDISGTVIIDSENKESSRVDLEVKVKSITTHNRQRDNHLKSEEFFSANKYPVMKFKTMAVTHISGNQYQLKGRLTVKDVSKDIVVPFTYIGMKENPLNPKQYVAGFEATFRIDRLEYHVGPGKYYQMGVIGKNVDITITLELLRKK